MVKKLALSVVAILVLLTACLLILPSFWDWNAEKGRIAEEVRRLTGRDLVIVGDVSLQLLPRPAFSAGQVSLANVEGGGSAQMIQLEELRIKVALFPLLKQQVLVETVTLVEPRVVLEVLPDGRRNWDFRSADAPADQASDPAAGAPLPGPGATPSDPVGSGDDAIRVDSFIVEGGTLLYRDAVAGVEERLTDLNAELAAESLAGPFVVSGSAAYQDILGEFDVSLGRMRDAGATALSFALRLPEAGASTQFSGALSRHEDLRTLRGRLQAQGKSLAGLLASVLGPDQAPPRHAALAQPFALEAEVSASPSEAEAADVTLQLGEISLKGESKVVLGDVPDVTAKLAGTRVDLDSLLAAFTAGETAAAATGQDQEGGARPPAPASPAPQAGASTADDPSFALPEDVTAELTLAVETLVYREQFARNLDASLRLQDGAVTVERLTAALPGGSDLSFSGTLKSVDAAPAFNGRIAAAADNLRALLRWLGVEIEAVPADRLRRMSLKTAIEANPRQVTLRDIDLRLDVSQVTGGVALALRERPGLGVGLAIDRVNLDAYLPKAGPDGAAQEDANGSAGQAGAEAPATEGAEDADPGSQPAKTSALAFLDDFDANIDMRVGALTYQGLGFDGLRLDATLQRGGLVVREASLVDLAGAGGRFAGSLANVAREPSFDGSLDISVTSLSRLMRTLDLPAQGQLPLESFTLTGAVNGNRQVVRFDQRLAALGGTLQAAGAVDLAQGPPALRSALALGHPDLTVLLGELLPGEKIPAGLGALDLKGQVTATAQSLAVSGLEGRVARTDLAGDLALDLAGVRPRITADLQTGALPLAALAAPAAAGNREAASGSNSGSASDTARSRQASGRDARWSDEPIDVSALRAFDAAVTLQSAAILLDNTKLDQARLEAGLENGLLDLKRFTATVYGGALSVTGKADARESAPGGLEVAAAVTAIEVDLATLLRELADTDRFSGPLTLESSLNASGASEAALINSLNGTGKIDGTVTVAAKAEEQAGALILDILGQKVKEVRGIADSTTLLFGAFAGAASKVDGTFVIEQGVLTTQDTRVRGRSAEALTAARIDLPTWQLDSQTDVFRDSDPQTAYLTAKLRGSLDGPSINIAGQPFQRRQEPAAESADPAQQDPDAAAGQPEILKPEEILKDGLKNLLKGLGG
ncbi:AsmA family protein [Pelagibius sp.]|uniref:AsmA family protein n=1 Tax=Pelagibius sp. TaxID=1931238 RepID=UPI00262963E6|nr:AsmA family protein [Pelagibius sp.]